MYRDISFSWMGQFSIRKMSGFFKSVNSNRTLLRLPVGGFEELDKHILKCMWKKKMCKCQVNFEKGRERRRTSARTL